MHSSLTVESGDLHWDRIALSATSLEKLTRAKEASLRNPISYYEGFGSFHSENVEDLIAKSDADYTIPTCFPSFARYILPVERIQHLRTHAFRPFQGATRIESSKFAISKAGPPAHSPTDSMSSDVYVEAATVGGQKSRGDSSPPSSDDSDSNVDERSLSAIHPSPVCEFGAPFRSAHFSISEEMVFINHGAFGGALVGAMAIKHLYEEHMEEEVVQFVDRELLPLLVYSIRCLSRFIHAKPNQVILVQNATFALNCAMGLIEKDDVVAYLDVEYLSVYKMMWYRCQEVGASLHEIAVSAHLHNEAVMGNDAALTEEICRQLPAGCSVVVIDYVTSTSALELPVFSHIIPALRKRGVSKIIVDGAHAPLQVDLNFDALPPESQPNVFVGNLHKWFSSPKAVGFFWIQESDREFLRSVVLSHGAGDGLLSEFIWDGTRDYGAYLCLPALTTFWEMQGVPRVREYCSSLLRSAVKMLTGAFGSRLVPRHAPFMALVELPEALQKGAITPKYIQDNLHDFFSIEVPVKRIEGRHYLRISAFVYNTPQEYVYLREAVRNIATKWEQLLLSQPELAVDERPHGERHPQRQREREEDDVAEPEKPPCDERIRLQGGCGVSGLEPSLKRRRTARLF